ncbi:MAG: glutathione S-transferase N-terminal domain-containing protein [Actinomycetes bacterium]
MSDSRGNFPLKLGGAYSSPYSLKMRAVLRYRQIPFRWVLRNSRWDDLPPVAVPIVPVIAFPEADGTYSEAMVDSSPQITRLEHEFTGRSLVPVDPALALIDFLIEDFADEWVCKMMYHYRWVNALDADKAGRLLPLDRDLNLSVEMAAQAKSYIIDRQVSRRALIGSTDNNQPIIEAAYERLLDFFQLHLVENRFVLGERPGRGDFGLFGQLKPMVWWDPTPMGIAVERSPRSVMWVECLDDLSWWEVDGDDGWYSIDDLPSTTLGLLAEIGRTYAPFMVANAAAFEAGADEMECEIDGATYRQAPFGYQVKCLKWLREAYAGLATSDRARVDAVLAGTGCDVLW